VSTAPGVIFLLVRLAGKNDIWEGIFFSLLKHLRLPYLIEREESSQENHYETDLVAALRLALGADDRIPTGIYHRRESPSYTDRIDKLNDKPLTDHRYRPGPLKALLTDGYS
jgi:hypothetical protein